MARIALSILWGGALCGLAYFILATMVLATRRDDDFSGLVVIVAFLFLALLLVTLSAANVFDVTDWITKRMR